MICRALAPVAFAVSLIVASGPSGAQTAAAYPTKPIRIVTSPAGGGNDFPGRLIARAPGVLVVPGTPQELTAVMTSEVARLGKVPKTAGIGVQ